jgi:hypothetical protein
LVHPFLVALKESILPAPAALTDVVYRFLYLPTCRPAISVRIERRDSIRMSVSQTDGWGGYDPKGLAWTRTVRLPLPAWDSLELALAAAHFWSDTVRKNQEGSTDRGGFWTASGQTGVFQSITGARNKSVPTRPSPGRATTPWISRTSRQTGATEGV